MTRRLLTALLLVPAALHAQDTPLQAKYRPIADRLIAAAMADSAAWNKLAWITDTWGHRISGSAALEQAIDGMLGRMKEEGLDNVRGEPAMVPHWVRGAESLEMIEPRRTPIKMLGLGGSIGTPAGGITAEVLVVSDFDDLKAHAAQAKGKIVVFNQPFEGYGKTVMYRSRGAAEASRLGAVASIIRSVGPYGMRTPHTGSMGNYDSTVAKIPNAAIPMEDAMMLHRMQQRGQKIVLHLAMSAQTLPDAPSRNVVAEIRGSEHPEEVVVMGGHIDSWDVGNGAMDDMGGVVIAWEAVRLMKQLGLKPRRTIRVVGWTNEENGGAGGQAYRAAHAAELDNHLLAIESDGGVFKPEGFGFTGSDSAMAIVQQIGALLKAVGADKITKGGGGADIGPIMQAGVPGMGHEVDGTKYFWFHHTEADNVFQLDPREVAMNTAAMAVMAFVVADMPERLPRK